MNEFNKTALLVVDMQKCFLKQYPDRTRLADVCEHINYAAGLLRKRGFTVVHIQDVESADSLTEDELGFIPEIEIEPDDVHVRKIFSNAFWKTDLDTRLRERGVGFVIVCGFAAEHCVLFTYNGAVERGYKTAILQNGIAGLREGGVLSVYLDRNLVSIPVLEFFFPEDQ